MGNFYDHTWGILDKSSRSSVSFTSICWFCLHFHQTYLLFFFYVAKACPAITLEQVDFLERVWAIPSEQRSWKRLVPLDTLHTFCGGSKPTPKAKRLDIFSQVQKWSLGRTSKRRSEKLLLSVLSQVDHRSLL